MPEPIHRSRPPASAIAPARADAATEVQPGIWMSPGLSNSYLITTTDGRVIVNTGMGFEGPVHRANFDAVDDGPVRYVLLTQGHYDHVGGVDVVRDPDSDDRGPGQLGDVARRQRAARAVPGRQLGLRLDGRDHGGHHLRPRAGRRRPARPVASPQPTITFDDTLTLELGGRRLELIATPGGETTDSMVVWLPDERVCLCGNIFGALFGHIPNLVTMRGDRYRDALAVIESIERVRALRPRVLLTGHFDPIEGEALIDAELVRLRDAVRYVHDETVRGMNAGTDVRHAHARDRAAARAGGRRGLRQGRVGRAGHLGELRRLVPPPVDDRALPDGRRRRCTRDLVELAGGADAIVARAAARAAAGEPLEAIAPGGDRPARRPDARRGAARRDGRRPSPAARAQRRTSGRRPGCAARSRSWRREPRHASTSPAAAVLVTGGTSGIGHGIATAFRDAGASVAVTGTRAVGGRLRHRPRRLRLTTSSS